MSLAQPIGEALPSPSYFNSEKDVLHMRKLVTRFAKNEEGAALVEYGMLVGLIAVVCIGAVTLLGTGINGVFGVIQVAINAIPGA
jgi:pilus assembly protein Flp/PilA